MARIGAGLKTKYQNITAHSNSLFCCEGVDSMSNQRSPVWNYFKKSDENDDPTCKLCKKKVKTKAGNTTNLMSHLKTNHLLVYTTLNRARKRTLNIHKLL